MPREDIRLTKFTVKYPYKKGFFRGKRESSDWTLPPVCPCCGAEAQEALPERVECDAGSRKYWLDLEVPYCGSCVEHVRARKGEERVANTLGVVAGLLLGGGIYAALWQYRGGGDPFEAVKNWEVFCIIIAGVCTWAALSWLLKRHYTNRPGAVLPSTENCTAPLKMELALENMRLLAEPDLQMHIFCANKAFADALRETNPDAFAEEKEITGVAERTVRGDLVIVDTMKIPTEAEIAAGE